MCFFYNNYLISSMQFDYINNYRYVCNILYCVRLDSIFYIAYKLHYHICVTNLFLKGIRTRDKYFAIDK